MTHARLRLGHYLRLTQAVGRMERKPGRLQAALGRISWRWTGRKKARNEKCHFYSITLLSI